MWKPIALLMLLFSAQQDKSTFFNISNQEDLFFNTDSCVTAIDSLTKALINIKADALPTNEGGKVALMKQLEKRISLESISSEEKFDSNIIVAFIIDTDGTLKGERIIKDETNKVGQQMLNIAKTFKWKPALCNGKSVPMLYTLPMIIDITEN